MEITAMPLSSLRPLSIANSPPVIANNATMGDRKMKWRVCPSHEKVNLLRKGLRAMHRNIPKIPTNKLKERTNLMCSSNICSSPLSKSSEIFFTALTETPKLVESLTNLIVELNSDIKPIPSGPNIIATSLLRTIPTRIFNPCTPPNKPVYLRIWL